MELGWLKVVDDITSWNRFDARGKPLSMGRSWSDLAAFGLRANFRFTVHGLLPRTGHLVINNITVEDEGVYRCRVDFKNSPARHNRAKLNVIGKIFTKFDKLSNDFKPIWISQLRLWLPLIYTLLSA